MKTEITLEELLKQITPLPWPETSDHDDAPAFEHQPNWDYARHSANVLPELVKAIRKIEKAFAEKCTATCMFSEDADALVMARNALSRAEKVTLP